MLSNVSSNGRKIRWRGSRVKQQLGMSYVGAARWDAEGERASTSPAVRYVLYAGPDRKQSEKLDTKTPRTCPDQSNVHSQVAPGGVYGPACPDLRTCLGNFSRLEGRFGRWTCKKRPCMDVLRWDPESSRSRGRAPESRRGTGCAHFPTRPAQTGPCQ